MASPSDHARRHADLLSRARGADVLSNEETLRLQQRARARKNKKLHFFNSEDGWMLRRIVRAHPVQRAPKQFCALCGINTGDAKKLRARPNSRCGSCFVNLCSVPNKQEPDLSCFQAWHDMEWLRPRAYPTSTARRGASTENESEPARSRSPQRTPSPAPEPQEQARSPSPAPRRQRRRTRRRLSISPSSSPERPRTRPRPSDSPGVTRFRAQVAEEERQRQAWDSVQDQAQRFVNSWRRGKSLEQLIHNLAHVLPPNITAPVFGELNTPQKVKTASRRARRAVHPDVTRRYNPTPLQQKIADYAFNALQEAFDRRFAN